MSYGPINRIFPEGKIRRIRVKIRLAHREGGRERESELGKDEGGRESRREGGREGRRERVRE